MLRRLKGIGLEITLPRWEDAQGGSSISCQQGAISEVEVNTDDAHQMIAEPLSFPPGIAEPIEPRTGADFHGFEGTNLRTILEAGATVSSGLISNLKFQI